jgi:MFS family permease
MSEPSRHKEIGRTLILTNLLTEPLFTLYNFLVFILYKDLGASTFQISLMTMLKPVVAILSFYWSAGLLGKSKKLKSNVLWAGFLMRAPFLLCPWIDSAWYVIWAAVNYMFFFRAGAPGWMEIIRRTAGKKGGRAFSYGYAMAYLEGVVLGFAFGGLLDKDPGLWKILFFGAAVVGLFSVAIQSRLKVQGEDRVEEKLSLKELLLRPWKDSYELVKRRPDFSRFQWGFMICGFGIMLVQPALPLFAVDVLGISYMEMAGAISIAKGLGVALSSPIWAKGLERFNFFRISSLVFLSMGLFPIMLSFAGWSVVWLYLAWFWYGVGQGGSHLVWNMSGPIFAGKDESSRYTGVNVALVGLRGAVAPPLGGWLAVLLGPVQVLTMGGILCLYSGIRMLQSKFAKDPFPIKV